MKAPQIVSFQKVVVNLETLLEGSQLAHKFPNRLNFIGES